MDSQAEPLPPHENFGPSIEIVHWTFFVLATVAVGLRIGLRLRKKDTALGWDDFTISVALIFAAIAGALEHYAIEAGAGRHFVYVPKQNLPDIEKYLLASTFANTLGTLFVKISVGIFILRLVQGTHKLTRWLLYFDLALLIPFTIAVAFVDLLQCQPVKGYWDKTINAKCINLDTINALLKAQSAHSVITDFLTVTIPLLIVGSLHLNRTRKVLLLILFSLGYFVTACSIAKTVTINWVPKDPTFDNTKVSWWGIVEHEFGIFVASLPVLSPLFDKALKSLSSTYHSIRYKLESDRPTADPDATTLKASDQSHDKSWRKLDESSDLELEESCRIHKRTDISVSAETMPKGSAV